MRGVCFLFLIWGICCSATGDFPFVQDISFRSYYDSLNKHDGISTAWEKLPFTLDKTVNRKGKFLSGSNGGLYMLDQGILFCAPLKVPIPSMESVENPFHSWKQIGDTGLGADANIMVASASTGSNSTAVFSFYTLSTDNVAYIELTGERGCGEISSTRLLLSDDSSYKWGDVASFDLSVSMNSLFVGSRDKGALVVGLDSSTTVKHVPLVGDDFLIGSGSGVKLATIRWVEEWRTLFVSTTLALFTVKYDQMDGKSVVVDTFHEWVGGVLGTVVEDMDYDPHSDYLWLAESESIHKLSRDGIYYRMGWQQGAPMFNVTSVAVSNGHVYAGSLELGMSRVSADASTAPVQVGIALDGHGAGSPWVWSYYYGPRYLPSNTIFSIVPINHLDSSSSNELSRNVLIVTDAGLTFLRAESMTLQEKARTFQSTHHPRHDRHGLISPCGLDEYGNLDSWHLMTNDNDGLQTGENTMGLAYRYMASIKNGGQGDEEARLLAWNGFEAMEHLSVITGSYPTFTARTLCKVSDGDIGCDPPDPACWYECWHDAPDRPGWQYKGDTSSDELTGHFATYALIHDHIAKTDEERERVLRLYEGLLMGIIDNDLYFIDPFTGSRTFWGFWNPKELNHEPEHYSERGLNSLQILSWLTQAYSLTGNKVYKDQFDTLVNHHRYIENTFNVKIDSYIDENHSDNELIMLGYHTLFYSYQRLGDDHPRKKEIQAMIEPTIPSLQKTFLLMKGELNPLWVGIYAGTCAQTALISSDDIEQAVWSLRSVSLDNIEWNLKGDQRIDLDFNVNDPLNVVRGGNGHIMKVIRPPAERSNQDIRYDPFAVNPNGDGNSEDDPGVFLFPYYYMLYNDLI